MRTGTTALLSSAVLLAGCSTTVTGTASPAGAGAFTELLGTVDLADVDDRLDPYDVVATPDGSLVVLLTGNLGTADRQGSALVELVPGDGGATVGTVTEGAAYAGDGRGGEVHVADDGTLVAIGPVVSADGEGWDLALTVLAPGAATADVRLVSADADLGTPDDATAALSPDGGTLYASLEWEVSEDRRVNRLAAIDVATGEIVAGEQVQVETDGVAVVQDVSALPDGGFAALVQNTTDRSGTESGPVLAEYDADLQLVGEPLELVTDEPYSLGYALEVLDDGTAVASVVASNDGSDARLVTVRDGAVQGSAELPGLARALAVDPAGRYAYANYTREENGAAVATVDLDSGEVVGDVVLCEELGSAADVALSADGGSLAALASCPAGDVEDPAFLLG